MNKLKKFELVIQNIDCVNSKLKKKFSTNMYLFEYTYLLIELDISIKSLFVEFQKQKFQHKGIDIMNCLN